MQKLRPSSSFYQINKDQQSIENLYKTGKIPSVERNTSFSHKNNHTISMSVNLGNPQNYENMIINQESADMNMSNYYSQQPNEFTLDSVPNNIPILGKYMF